MTRLRALHRLLAPEHGYTLSELLVVLSVLGIVLGRLTAVFVSGSRAELDMNKRFQAQLNALLALARLRADIHIAACTPSGSGFSSLFLYASSPTSGACTGNPTVAWCVATSPTTAGRYAVYRVVATSCANPTSGVLTADYLTTNALFSIAWPTFGSKQRETVAVTLPINVNPNTAIDGYTLNDSIVLRNFPPASLRPLVREERGIALVLALA